MVLFAVPPRAGQSVRVSTRTRYDEGDGLTAIADDLAPLLSGVPSTPIEVCAVAQGLVALPDLAAGFGIPEARAGERNIRAASDILRTLLALDAAPIDHNRAFTDRIVGTCRHFAVLSCALLRYRGIAARARCGFATYFVPGSFVDHWIVEYRLPADDRWFRVDSQILGFEFVDTPEDLAPGAFLTGGEAWSLCREGRADPADFGVVGFPLAWGIGEIRGNAIRDLAALNKVEMLPWDAWGRMEDSYDGKTGADYDELMDTIAATCAADDGAAIEQLYDTEDLAVPTTMVV
jgi:hypothetical protein